MDENPPVFRITHHDRAQVVAVDPRTQQPVSVSASPANSEFGFPAGHPNLGPALERRVSVDPATYSAFGNLALSSNPGSPALFGGEGSPFSESHAPESAVQPTGALHLGTDGLLAPGPAGSGPPLSPGSAFTTAIGTPLPPSPSPYQHSQFGNVGLGVDLPGEHGQVAHVDASMFMQDSPVTNPFATPAADRVAGESGLAPAGEELDVAGLLQGPGSVAYQGKGAKKRPATGSMDLNIQPSR